MGRVLPYPLRMRKPSGGRLGLVLGLASALVSACSSSSNGDPHGASGATGAAAGASAHGGTSSSAGTAGAAIVAEGGTADGGAHSGASGASGDSGASGESGGAGGAGGAQNVFVAQLVLSDGGGPPHCLPRSLPIGPPGTGEDGRVPCWIAELKPGACDCSRTARASLNASILSATRNQLQSSGNCGGDTGVSCDSFCGCEIVQAPGLASDSSSELYACQNDLTVPANVDGFCVIDQGRTDASGAPAPLGNPALVAECPTSQKRLLRFVGAGEPANEATVFIACAGSSAN